MIRRGAIGFSTHRTRPLSRAIRWFTKYEYSHSFLVADHTWDGKRVYLLEAKAPQISFDLLENYQNPEIKYEIWYPRDVSEEDINCAMLKTERMFLRKRYSLASLVGIGITILVQQFFGKIIRNPLRMGAWCAEADWYYLSQLMPDLFGWMDHTTVSPKDLHMIVQKSGRFSLVASKDFNVNNTILSVV